MCLRNFSTYRLDRQGVSRGTIGVVEKTRRVYGYRVERRHILQEEVD